MAQQKAQRWIIRFRGETIYLERAVAGVPADPRSDTSRILDFCRAKWGGGRLIVEREQTLMGEISTYRWLLEGEDWDYDPHAEDI